jgi:BolA protein
MAARESKEAVGMSELGPVGRQMEEALRQAFQPVYLEIIDESHRHAGHAGAHPQGESHFRVIIVSPVFAGKSLVQRHRMVNEALAELLRERVHALAITARTPEETPKG